MADEQLRLVASLKDNASAGVRAIGRQLKTVRVEPGMQQAQKWVRGFNDDVAQFKKGGLTVANVMSSMGVGGLAAAGSIGALAAQFKQLADHILDVKELGREIGVTTDQLRAMERAGAHFGFDPSAMDAALKRLAGFMPILRRGGNNELTQALARAPELIAKIRGEASDTAAVFKDVMGYVAKLQDPQDRIKFYEQIFGNGDLEKLNAEGAGGFEAQVGKARKSLEPFTKEAEAQAQALRQAIGEFNTAVERLELKVAPAVFAGMKQAADDFREAFGVIEKAYEWYKANKEHPAAAAGKSFADAVHERRVENEKHPDGIVFDAPAALDRALETVVGKKALGRGDFAPAKDDADKAARLAAMQAELDAVAAKLAADKNPVSFATREADTIARVRELRDAIGTLKGLSSVPSVAPLPLPQVAPLPPLRPPEPAFRVPSRYDAEGRARRGRDDLDGFVVGALGPVLHLNNTLKTAADRAKDDGIHPAAFHPNGMLGPVANSDPASIIEAGTKAGVIAAFRELSGLSGADGSTARNGMMPVSYGGSSGGRGGGSRDGNPALGGGSFDTSGGGTTRASGTLAANQREAYAAAIGEGLSKTAARALVADFSGESLRNPHDYHYDRKHMSGGIGQWDPERSAYIKEKFGDVPWKLSVADQTRAAIWEYRNKPRFAPTKRAMEGNDPEAMIGALVDNFENPLDKVTARRQRMGYLRGFDPDAAPASSGQMVGLERVGKLASEQCVALAAAAVKFRGSVTEWRKGDGAEAGTLRPGTPVATFLNRDGSQSGRYAGGGIGTPGVHLDHAGVFQRYVMDGAGKRIGIEIAEQFKGSHGPHLRRYMFGQGWGEGNGSNYFGVNGPDGKPLGGANNPMSDLRDAAHALRGAAGDQRTAARAVAAVPAWHDASRPDLGAESRKTVMQEHRIAGGVDAHIHVHEGQVRSARASSSGHVRDARITVRTAPQRTATV